MRISLRDIESVIESARSTCRLEGGVHKYLCKHYYLRVQLPLAPERYLTRDDYAASASSMQQCREAVVTIDDSGEIVVDFDNT